MNLLVLDRSIDTQSAALVVGGKIAATKVFPHSDARSADWPLMVRDFLAQNKLDFASIDEILVGQGPGSFSGIRAALALAQGLVIPNGKKVVGLPSSMALTRDGAKVAVVGDARRDRFWVVLYDGIETVRNFTLVSKEELASAVPDGYSVATPDGIRIENLLKAVFSDSYIGSAVPLAGRLAEVAIAKPDLPVAEPLPIYLSAAVR